MIKRSIVFPLMLVVAAISASRLVAQGAGEGRSFVLTLPYTAPPSIYTPPIVRLVVTSTAGASVQLLYTSDGAVENFNVAAGASYETIVDSAHVMLGKLEGNHRATIQISASAPVAVRILLDREFASEAYSAIPDALLGVEYMAIASDASDYSTFLAVVGVSQNTVVTITPTVGSIGGRPPGVPFQVQLDRGEVFQYLSAISSTNDITGSLVVADHPVGVISGAICVDLPIGVAHACNPLIEQLPAIDSWGSEFVVAPPNRGGRGLIRVLASCDSTIVSTSSGARLRLDRAGTFDFYADTAIRMSSSAPLLVAQIITSTATSTADLGTPYGDPSMMIVPALHEASDDHLMSIPSLAARRLADIAIGWRHFLRITFPLAAESSLQFDGLPPVWSMRQVVGSWGVGVVNVGPGDHRVRCDSGVVVAVYGYSIQDAYALPTASITRTPGLVADDFATIVCSDTLDTAIVIRNIGSQSLRVERLEFLGQLSGEVTYPILPLEILPGDSAVIWIKLRGIRSGRGGGTVWLRGSPCDRRLGSFDVDVTSDILYTAPPDGSLIDFGGLASTIPSVDTLITVSNGGTATLVIRSLDISPGVFAVVSPSLPISIPPGGSATIRIRFAPTVDGVWAGGIVFRTSNCSDSLVLRLAGKRGPGAYITADASVSIRLLCGAKRADTLRVVLSNSGDRTLGISGVMVVGSGSTDVAPILPLPLSIAPRDSANVYLLYIPNAPGVVTATLVVVSNAINRDTLLIPLDIRNDTTFLQSEFPSYNIAQVSLCADPPYTTIRLANSGTVAVPAISATSSNGATMPLLLSAGPYKPGDDIAISVSVLSRSIGSGGDTLLVINPICNDTLAIPVTWDLTDRLVTASIDTLVFRSSYRCDTSVQHRNVLITNRGPTAESVAVVGLPTDPSVIVTIPTIPIVVPAEGSIVVTVDVHPAQSGLVDSLVFRPAGCTELIVVHLRRETTRSADLVYPEFIDFGTVPSGSNAIRSFFIVNPGAVPREVISYRLLAQASNLSLVIPGLPLMIGTGDSLLVGLEWEPSGVRLADTLEIIFGECNDTVRIPISGRTRARSGLRLVTRDATGSPGEIVDLELRVEPLDGLGVELDIVVDLQVDRSLLLPKSAMPVGLPMDITLKSLQINGMQRVALIGIRGSLPASGATIRIPSIVALGSVDTTLISIGNVHGGSTSSTDSIEEIEREEGMFRLEGICRDGSGRLVRFADPVVVLRVYPQPAQRLLHVVISGVNQSDGDLMLFDRGGAHVSGRTIQAGDGDRNLLLDISELPSGWYILELRVGNSVVKQSVVIAR